MGHVTAGLSSQRLALHMNRLLSDAVTSMISSGEICPELNMLGFNVDRVSECVNTGVFSVETRFPNLHC